MNITLLGLALIGSVLPTSIVFLSQAEEADTLNFTLDYLLGNHQNVQYLHHRDELSCSKSPHASNRSYRFRWAILFFSLMFLVILSGDVELNPGPLGRFYIDSRPLHEKGKSGGPVYFACSCAKLFVVLHLTVNFMVQIVNKQTSIHRGRIRTCSLHYNYMLQHAVLLNSSSSVWLRGMQSYQLALRVMDSYAFVELE